MNPKQKGKLKIFFSYAECEGSTQAMLHAAQTAKAQGIRVLVGYLTARTSAETRSLLEGLEQLPVDRTGAEFDLERVLSLRPDLCLVEELGHRNGKGARHRKRYQDVEELLRAGIDVYTTANVSSVESLHDTVASITGTAVQDRIPDDVFDRADQMELIDIEPEELKCRLTARGESDISIEQLTALREIALRRCADRVRRLSDRMQKNGDSPADEHILVCLSASPSNPRIIRTAARMAQAFNSRFTALFIQTPDFDGTTPENKKRLQDNQKLAEELGADIELIFGEDIPCQIAEFARLSGVTKIVLGRSAFTRRHRLGKSALTEQLLSYVPEIDIHIIPDFNAGAVHTKRKTGKQTRERVLCSIAQCIGILAAATLLGELFYRLGFSEANIIMVYILGVLLTSVATTRRIYSLISSAASVILFHFLFTAPRFSLSADTKEYPVTFLVMFLTAYVTGTFAISYKEQAGQSGRIAHRARILFDTDQMLSKVRNKEEIIHVTATQIRKLLERNVVIYETGDGRLSKLHLYPVSGNADQIYDREREMPTVEWVLKNNHAAGATTDTMSESRYLYLALRINDCVYGIVGIEAENAPIDAFEHGVLLSILGECALALENEQNAREKEAAAVLARSEQLRANLLRTISHDLRTPLTTISGNASNLISNGSSFDEQTKQRIYSDIYDDSMWLINLVENLLSATRIEEGKMTLHASTELLDDVVEEALRHIRPKAVSHRLSAALSEELLLVRVDARLIGQVIVNLVDNALKYTPEGTAITVTTEKKEGMAHIRVSDTGPGIPPEDKEKIFEKFCCGSNEIVDNRRSLGLGLYLCRAIVEAHGGSIRVTDNSPRGAVFTFTLPLEEVTLHE